MERENRRQVHHRMIENEQYRVDGDQLTINQLTNTQRTFTQATLNNLEFADNCDTERSKNVTAAISEFLVHNALSFNLVESPKFIIMLKSLNCAYTPPKRDVFRTKELDNLFDRTSGKLDDKWRLMGNPMKTLGFDGYTDDNSNSVLNIIVSALGVSACEDSIDPGTEAEDANFLATTVLAALEKKGENVEENYAGVVADNTSANTNALKMITRRYPKLIACGCIGHISDLMIEDLFEVPAFKGV